MKCGLKMKLKPKQQLSNSAIGLKQSIGHSMSGLSLFISNCITTLSNLIKFNAIKTFVCTFIKNNMNEDRIKAQQLLIQALHTIAAYDGVVDNCDTQLLISDMKEMIAKLSEEWKMIKIGHQFLLY